MICPVCQARNDGSAQCRRCRADLSILIALEERRRRLLNQARRAARGRKWARAVRLAEQSARLRSGVDADRLRVAGALVRRDFAGAWRTYTARRAGPQP